MGAVTQYGYDAEGELTSVTDALGNVTQCMRTICREALPSVTDANNHVTSYTYDGVNRKGEPGAAAGANGDVCVRRVAGNEISHVDFPRQDDRHTTSTSAIDCLLTKVPGMRRRREPTVTFAWQPDGGRGRRWVDASGSTTYGYDTRDLGCHDEGDTGGDVDLYLRSGRATWRASGHRTGRGTSVANYAWDSADATRLSVTDNRAGGVTTAAYTRDGAAEHAGAAERGGRDLQLRCARPGDDAGVAARRQPGIRELVVRLQRQRAADERHGRNWTARGVMGTTRSRGWLAGNDHE